MDYEKVIRERRPKLRDNSVTAYALSLKAIAPQDNKDMDYLDTMSSPWRTASSTSV